MLFIDAFVNGTIIFQIVVTSEDDSNTGSVVMQYNTSNCLVQQSWIRFRNAYDKTEYNTFVNSML